MNARTQTMAAEPDAADLEQQSKAQRAYEWISRKIRTREFEPGDRLVLASIGAEIGMSAVPVREAMRQLEAEGLVTYHRNVGATVTTYNRESYYNLMEIVAMLEAQATAQSSRNLKHSDLKASRRVNAQLRAVDVSRDPEEFTRLNKEFHRILFRRCPNQMLLDLLEEQWTQLDYRRVSTFRYIPGRARRSVEEHDQLIALIEAGADAWYIERVAREHRLRTSQAYREKMEAPPAAAHPSSPPPPAPEPNNPSQRQE